MWDIATAQAKTGSNDALLLQNLMDTAMAVAERYCDRGIAHKQEVVKYYDIEQDYIQLPRYPVQSIDSWDTGRNGETYKHLHRSAGKVMFHGQRFFEEITILYTAGYQNLPADLELAMWDIFMTLWDRFGAGAGAGAPTIQLGAVKKKTIVGVGSIEYETGSASVEKSSSADLSALMPGAVMALLEPYRRYDV